MQSITETCCCGGRISILATGSDSIEETLVGFRAAHDECGREEEDETEAEPEECAWCGLIHGAVCPTGFGTAAGSDEPLPRCAYCGGIHEGNCPKYVRDAGTRTPGGPDD